MFLQNYLPNFEFSVTGLILASMKGAENSPEGIETIEEADEDVIE